MSLDSTVVFITGAGSGMGRLAAHRMADAGASVAGFDVDEAGLAETLEMAANRSRIHTWKLDVVDTAAVNAAVKEVEGRLGPIDRVYNAAAIMPTGFLLEQDTETILRVMEIDYGGVVNVSKATLPGMLERGRGDLINFASVAGWVPTMHFGAYNAAKFAVVAFTDVLYHENRGRGVRFACVCPPPVATPLLDQATSKPKVLDEMGDPIAPEQVLDAIEKGLDRGKLMIFPDRRTRFSVLMRRLVPGLVWSGVHRIEGR